MKKMVNLFDKIAFNIWVVVCVTVAATAFFFTAIYNMGDFPNIEYTKAVDVIFVCLVLFLYIVLFKYRKVIEDKVPYWVIMLIFGGVALAFILLIPILPFSDMKYISEGAIALAKGEWGEIRNSDYMQAIVKNLKVSSFYSLFIIFLPKNVMSLRIINVLFYILTSYACGRLVKKIIGDYEKCAFIYTASFIPLIMYTNHVYFDLPVLCLCTLAMWCYVSDKKVLNIIISAILIGVASCLRISAFILAVVIIVDCTFSYFKSENKKFSKILLYLCLFVFTIFSIQKSVDTFVNHNFRAEGAKNESIWNLFCMGINEPEFGMMHNEYQKEGSYKTFSDFYELLKSRDMSQNAKLFGRKIFWTWSQGTYQAQRYGFGYDAASVADKFLYATPLTIHFLNSAQLLPVIIIALARAQYMAFWVLMTVGLLWIIKEKRFDKYRVFVYMFLLTFGILIFYEMKSRYVFHLITCMIPLAIVGLCWICEKKEREEKEEIKGLYRSSRPVFVTSGIIVCFVLLSTLIIWHKDDKMAKIAQEKMQNAMQLAYENNLTVNEREAVIPNLNEEHLFLYCSDMNVNLVESNDSAQQLERWIDFANTLDANAVLLGGDILQDSNAINVDWLNQNLNRLGGEYVCTAGDQDGGILSTDVCTYIDYGDFLICQVNNANGKIAEETLTEFKNVYKKGTPMILMMHVPLLDMKETAGGCDESTERFIDMVLDDKSPVFMVLDGHIGENREQKLNDNIVEYTLGLGYARQAFLIRIKQ